MALWVSALVVSAGCHDRGGDPENPAEVTSEAPAPAPAAAVPDIGGSWRGIYSSPTDSQSLTAEVNQGGRRLSILTSMTGEGQVFTGYFKDNGSIYLEDATTGEIWTSIGNISDAGFTIRDYLFDSLLANDSPVQSIRFSR